MEEGIDQKIMNKGLKEERKEVSYNVVETSGSMPTHRKLVSNISS